MLPLDVTPQLADAYAHEATADPVDSAPATDPRWALSERFERRHRLGKTGVGVMLGGIGVATVGTVVLTVELVHCFDVGVCGGAMAGVGLIVAGGIGATVGEVMMFTGGISAAYDGRSLGLDLSPTLGWVGVGLIGGGFVLSGVSGALAERGHVNPLGGIGSVAGLAGFICGAVQLGQVGRAGRHANLVVLPSANGLIVGGRFGAAGTRSRTGSDPAWTSSGSLPTASW